MSNNDHEYRDLAGGAGMSYQERGDKYIMGLSRGDLAGDGDTILMSRDILRGPYYAYARHAECVVKRDDKYFLISEQPSGVVENEISRGEVFELANHDWVSFNDDRLALRSKFAEQYGWKNALGIFDKNVRYELRDICDARDALYSEFPELERSETLMRACVKCEPVCGHEPAAARMMLARTYAHGTEFDTYASAKSYDNWMEIRIAPGRPPYIVSGNVSSDAGRDRQLLIESIPGVYNIKGMENKILDSLGPDTRVKIVDKAGVPDKQYRTVTGFSLELTERGAALMPEVLDKMNSINFSAQGVEIVLPDNIDAHVRPKPNSVLEDLRSAAKEIEDNDDRLYDLDNDLDGEFYRDMC